MENWGIISLIIAGLWVILGISVFIGCDIAENKRCKKQQKKHPHKKSAEETAKENGIKIKEIK